MSLRTRIDELTTATGSPLVFARKLGAGAKTVATLLSPRERHRRLDRLVEVGVIDAKPTGWQLTVAAHHMLFGFLLPSNLEFYAHYEQSHHWQQILRFFDDPSGMLDPIGLGISRDSLVTHLLQVVHTSAGYDLALLEMFDDGLDELRQQLEQVIAGTHPRQAAIELTLEREDYAERLLAALDAYQADREANWEGTTYPAPEDCRPRFVWGLENFGTPARFMRYACELPETPFAELSIPAPPAATTR